MVRRRWSLLLVAPAGLAIAELWVGARIRNGHFRELPLPPYGVLPEDLRADLEGALEGLGAGEDAAPEGGFDARYGWIHLPPDTAPPPDDGLLRPGDRPGRAYAPAPAPGVRRVVCLGDSFTFGSEVSADEAWPAQLEALSGGKLEVLNLGVRGWGADQALLRWRDVGGELRADVALLGIALGGIGRNVSRYRPWLHLEDPTPAAKPRFLLEGDELALLPLPYATAAEFWGAVVDGSVLPALAPDDHWAGDEAFPRGSSLARVLAAWDARRRRTPERLWSRPEGEPFRVTVACLERFCAEAREAGASEAAVLIFPPRADLALVDGPDWRERVFWRTLHAELERRGVPFVDLARTLAEARDRGPLYRSAHLSPLGNRVVAAWLAGWLLERG